eukprot:9885953-Lingulodinium_polyedra.AAC.1
MARAVALVCHRQPTSHTQTGAFPSTGWPYARAAPAAQNRCCPKPWMPGRGRRYAQSGGLPYNQRDRFYDDRRVLPGSTKLRK